MKNCRHFLNLGTLLLVFAVPAFAQTTVEECDSIYQVVTTNHTSPELTKLEQALTSGKEYLTKCKELPGVENASDLTKWVSEQVPKLEDRVVTMKLEQTFNSALKKRNRDEIVSSAKRLLERKRPYELDLILDIASVGFDNASASSAVDKYNADTITYAKMALNKLAAGDKSGNKEKYGFYVEYKTANCSDGSANATGWMNYTIGYVMLVRQKNAKDGLPYLYEASQNGCETKTLSENFRMIGSWYIDESNQISARRAQLLATAENKETPESSALFDLQMGYIDRAIDAYARAYSSAMANPRATSQYKTTLQSKLKELFGIRYDGDTSKMDDYVSKVMSTPLPNPSTPVAPVPTSAAKTNR